MTSNKQPNDHHFANLFEEAANISKAHGYDILAKQVVELKEENERLKEALKEELSNRESTWDADDPKSSTYEAIQKIKSLIQIP